MPTEPWHPEDAYLLACGNPCLADSLEKYLTRAQVKDILYDDKGLRIVLWREDGTEYDLCLGLSPKGGWRWDLTLYVNERPQSGRWLPSILLQETLWEVRKKMPNPLTPITKETPWLDSRTGKYVADAPLPNRQFVVSLLVGDFFTVTAQTWDVRENGEARFYLDGHIVCTVAPGQWRYVQVMEKVGDGSNP